MRFGSGTARYFIVDSSFSANYLVLLVSTLNHLSRLLARFVHQFSQADASLAFAFLSHGVFDEAPCPKCFRFRAIIVVGSSSSWRSLAMIALNQIQPGI